MENISKEILRPIGTIIVSLIGFVSIFIKFNEVFIGLVFGFLILDSVSALMIYSKKKENKKK